MKKVLCMLLALAMALLMLPAAGEEDEMILFAVNVGKGDALLLSSGSQTWLIDTGTQEHWGDLSCALKVLEVDHLTGAIFTHTDRDHVGGAMALAMSGIRVDGWYAPMYFADVKESKHPVMLAARQRGQQVTWLQAGDTLPLGDGHLKVLGPMSPSDTENCNSLVLLAETSHGRMLLTGDMEFPEEVELLGAGVIGQCSVLKVANHGEDDATSEALIRYVRPRIALISTSTQEEPDTPSLRVLRLLMQHGAEVIQTQHAECGVLVTLQNGIAEAKLMDYGPLPELHAGIRLTGRDAKADHIRIHNESGSPADLSGWYVVSERGSQLLVLPEGTVLAPGGELLISSLSSDEAGDVIWPEKKVWHKSKEDAARLYDAYGRLADELK